MGPFAAASNTSLYGDGTHPTTLGYSILAPILAAVINPTTLSQALHRRAADVDLDGKSQLAC